MKRGIIIVSVALFLAVCTPVYALGAMYFPYPQPGPFYGIRAMGMSGAVVACADDFTAAYWNPAGLSLNNGSIGISGLVHGRPELLFALYPYYFLHLYGEPALDDYLDLNENASAVWNMPQHDSGLYAAGFMDHLGVSWHRDVSIAFWSPDERTIVNKRLSNTFTVSVAHRFELDGGRWLALGLNGNCEHKVESSIEVTYNVNAISEERIVSTMFSLDAGMLYQISEQWRVGVMMHNVVAFGSGVCSYVLKDDSAEDPLFEREEQLTLIEKPSFDLGLAYTPNWMKGLTITVDLHGIRAKLTKDYFIATADSMHFGLEQRFGPFSLWLGNQWTYQYGYELTPRFSGGIGIEKNQYSFGIAALGNQDDGWAIQAACGYQW